MSELETRSFEQLPAATAVSPTALTAVQEPGGPMQKLEIRQLLGRLISTEEATETEEDLQGLLDYDANSVGLVFADPDPALNGWYRKVGAPGAGTWEQFEKLSADASAEVQALVDQAEDAADAAAASVAQVQSLFPARLALGQFINANPTIANGFYFATGSGLNASDAWRAYEVDDGVAGQIFEITLMVDSPILNAASFFDAGNAIVGDPIGLGPGTGITYYEKLRVVWPAGAVTMRGTARAADTVVDGKLRKGGVIVERLSLDDDRADEIAGILANQPAVEHPWDPALGYYNVNGAFVDLASVWNYQVFPIRGGQTLLPYNLVKNGSVTAAIVFGQGFNPTTKQFARVLDVQEIGLDGTPDNLGTVVLPGPRVAPHGTEHVAITNFGDRNVRVLITGTPDANYGRDMSALLDIMNPVRGETLLFDGDSLYQGGGITGSVPAQVSSLLTAVAVNRAIGGSSPCNGLWYLREGADTIGLTGMRYSSVRALGGCSLAELEERRTNWASFWRDRIPDRPDTISDDEYAFWQACSYENSIVPFMDSADRMLCNHAHNADPQSVIPYGWSTFTGTLTGTNIDNAVLTVTGLTGTLQDAMQIHTNTAFDSFTGTGLFIDNQLTGTLGEAGTYKVRGTFPGAIATTAMNARTLNFGWSERQLVVPGPGGTAGHTARPYNDRGYYIGAMRFRLDLWRVAKGGNGFRSTFILDGYDQYDQKPNVCESQLLFQRLTRVPLLKTWDYSSWSQNVIPSGPNAGKTVKQAWLPGESFALHDFADPSGLATRHRANLTAKLLLVTPIGL
ncbi:hypothetical protein [Blastomonas fulva]|uniref:hypothetical protein n=1 Tax=Blastomonas fulva TaxID=1550728 RepID=UPI0025A3ECEA|nr:hypothetical protein [Blastomonas fulva]MDM7928680.1 hypothetical protein [Blastomonas fulva]MDM7964466.1 hypothetical protein [Blastomonas fulva]